MNNRAKRIWTSVIAAKLILVSSLAASAGEIEASGSFGFNRSNYTPTDYNWTRRWSASIGYSLFDVSEISLSFQDIFDRTFIDGYQNTEFHDQIYSLDWTQDLIPRKYIAQPFVKGGIGQLNRSASGTYANGTSPALTIDRVTVILGAGFRFFLTKRIAFKSELTSYLTGGSISTYRDNLSYQFGVSIFF